ncbi:MAG: 1,4-alpha-glucan branching protein domain-containing protein [Promethearchaeota archaeon]
MQGTFSFMLHAHMPYARKSGRWPAGEEWVFEAMLETYIPLLSVFRRFQQNNLHPKTMIGIVPILAEQLADPYMNDQFCKYMEDKIKRANRDCERFENQPQKLKIAQYWLEIFTQTYNTYKKDFYGNLMGTLKWLQEEGVIEVITSAATHGFLPLMEFDSSIYSQIHIGVKTYEKYFGKKPKGIWLPECAYRYREWSHRENRERKSIDEWLADEKIKYFFVENIGIEKADFISNKNNEDHPSINQMYMLESGVCVVGRNQATGKKVWSPDHGYPGDPAYREFHMKDSQSGLYYWRITGKPEKELYDPEQAVWKIKDQAQDFVQTVNQNLLSSFEHLPNCHPIINSQYDCELFGHWWWEGPIWLEEMYTQLLTNDHIAPMALSEYIEKYKDKLSVIRMKSSSWGEGGDFRVWNNPEHGWLWPYINSSSFDFQLVLDAIYNQNQQLNERDMRILKQTARELLLLEGSDWPFLLYTKQAKDYANQRFHRHHQRFNKLLWAAKNLNDKRRISNFELSEIEDIDNPWPNIDIWDFKYRK